MSRCCSPPGKARGCCQNPTLADRADVLQCKHAVVKVSPCYERITGPHSTNLNLTLVWARKSHRLLRHETWQEKKPLASTTWHLFAAAARDGPATVTVTRTLPLGPSHMARPPASSPCRSPRSQAGTAGLTAVELERLARMGQIRARMHEMGLLQDVARLQQATAGGRRAAATRKPPLTLTLARTAAAVPQGHEHRRSLRLQGVMQPPIQPLAHPQASLGGAPASTGGRGPRRDATGGGGDVDGDDLEDREQASAALDRHNAMRCVCNAYKQTTSDFPLWAAASARPSLRVFGAKGKMPANANRTVVVALSPARAPSWWQDTHHVHIATALAAAPHQTPRQAGLLCQRKRTCVPLSSCSGPSRFCAGASPLRLRAMPCQGPPPWLGAAARAARVTRTQEQCLCASS